MSLPAAPPALVIPDEDARSGGGRAWVIAGSAAGLLALALAVFALWSPLELRDVVYRGGAQPLASLVPEGTPIARDDVLLQWDGAPRGTRYNLRLMAEDLTLLHVEGDLAEPAFRVPEEMLRSVPAGGKVLWQVELLLPDGTRELSELFSVQLGLARDGSDGEGNRPEPRP